MTVVGFTFTKMNVERKNPSKGKININNNVIILNIEESTFSVEKEQDVSLKVTFQFDSTYEPDIGFIQLIGELIYVDEKEAINGILKEWNASKRISKEVMTEVLNVILNRCNIEALILARDINLPSPIPLPKVKVETK